MFEQVGKEQSIQNRVEESDRSILNAFVDKNKDKIGEIKTEIEKRSLKMLKNVS